MIMKIFSWIKKVFFTHISNVNSISSKGSLRLVDINKEMHRIIDSLQKCSVSKWNKHSIKYCLIDHLESLTFIENHLDKILLKIKHHNIVSKIKSIIRWDITTIIKIIDASKREIYANKDMNSMMKFLYDSTWKLIIIFEEVLGVKCKICKKQKREISYPYSMQSDLNPVDEEQFEIELIKMIREFDT